MSARCAGACTHRPVIFALFLASLVAAVGLFMIMPQDFLPARRHQRACAPRPRRPTAPPSTRWCAISKQAAAIVNADPNVDGAMSAVGAGGPTHRHQQRLHVHPPEDRVGAQARRRSSRPRTAPQARRHSRHQRLPAQSARHPHRRHASQAALSIHACRTST